MEIQLVLCDCLQDKMDNWICNNLIHIRKGREQFYGLIHSEGHGLLKTTPYFLRCYEWTCREQELLKNEQRQLNAKNRKREERSGFC